MDGDNTGGTPPNELDQVQPGANTPPPASAAPPAPQTQQSTLSDSANSVQPDADQAKAESWGSKVYHGVLNALGGSNDVSLARDPATGKMVATAVKSGPGQQWKRIISGALTGAAAGAGQTGPGGLGRSFGAGYDANAGKVRQQQQDQRQQANEDFEAQQKAVTAQAQNALLSHQIAASTFNLGRAQVEAGFADSERESNFEKIISDGGDGSTDMGVFPDFKSVIGAFKDMPELHDHQAGGRLVTIPHVNAEGKIDGVHAALVSPDWLSMKINKELPITVRNFKNGKVEESTFTIPANTLTGDQYSKLVMSESKDALDDWTKQADEKLKARQVGAEESRVPSENAKDWAEAAKANSSANADVDYGPGGQKGFNSWHDKNVTPALQTETSYQISSQAYNEYKAAQAAGKKLDTGAQGMQMLSQHIATTFGTVKGARITKDMIQAHLGARSVSDTLQVAVQKLSNGDPLSKDQWDAYGQLISQKRDEQWRAVLNDAVSLGRPLDKIAFPPDLRQKWGLGPGNTSPNAPGTTMGNKAPTVAGPGAGKSISLASARQLPQFKGQTDDQIKAAATALHYTVTE